MQRTIPCQDCAEATLDVQQKGFHVTGCNAHPTRAGFCILTFQDADAQQPVAAIEAAPGAAAVALALAAPAGTGALTATQAATAKAIVNLFETDEVLGDYSKVTLIDGDTGHLSFGKSQTTLGSGNLAKLLQEYCANPGARFAARIAPFLPRFAAGDESLDDELRLHNVLRASADDPVMRETQDAFFDRAYWQPAVRAAAKLGLRTPLAMAVVYDSVVHGSWVAMRDRTNQDVGSPAAIGEQAWLGRYVKTRRAWLANNAQTVLRPTVYRMDAFQRLLTQEFWALTLPIVVRGKEISPLTLSAAPRGCYDGPQPGSRMVALQTPLVRGLDVRLIQLGLSDRGMDILADGIFGQTSSRIVKAWQEQAGRPVSGVVDMPLCVELTA